MHFRRLEAITRARNVPLMLAALTAASALLAAPRHTPHSCRSRPPGCRSTTIL